MTTGRELIAASMSEGDLDAQVRKILKDLPGVLGYHTRYSAGSHAGFPDWTFAGVGLRAWFFSSANSTPPGPANVQSGNPACDPAEYRVW